jgi:hypothetical protein
MQWWQFLENLNYPGLRRFPYQLDMPLPFRRPIVDNLISTQSRTTFAIKRA